MKTTQCIIYKWNSKHILIPLLFFDWTKQVTCLTHSFCLSSIHFQTKPNLHNSLQKLLKIRQHSPTQGPFMKIDAADPKLLVTEVQYVVTVFYPKTFLYFIFLNKTAVYLNDKFTHCCSILISFVRLALGIIFS